MVGRRAQPPLRQTGVRPLRLQPFSGGCHPHPCGRAVRHRKFPFDRARARRYEWRRDWRNDPTAATVGGAALARRGRRGL